MKTLSGTFTFVVLAVVAIVAVITFRAFAQPTPTPAPAHKKFALHIGGPTKEDYVEVKSQGEFDTALKALAKNGGQYTIRFKDDHGKVFDPYDPDHHVSIKTDKIITSELAKNAPAGESVVNDPNVTTHLSSDSATDIKSVLDTFQ